MWYNKDMKQEDYLKFEQNVNENKISISNKLGTLSKEERINFLVNQNKEASNLTAQLRKRKKGGC